MYINIVYEDDKWLRPAFLSKFSLTVKSSFICCRELICLSPQFQSRTILN